MVKKICPFIQYDKMAISPQTRLWVSACRLSAPISLNGKCFQFDLRERSNIAYCFLPQGNTINHLHSLYKTWQKNYIPFEWFMELSYHMDVNGQFQFNSRENIMAWNVCWVCGHGYLKKRMKNKYDVLVSCHQMFYWF